MDTLLEAFLDAPDLVKKMDLIYGVLDREAKRRARFYEEMTPDQKVEFINGVVVMHSPVKWQHGEALLLLSRLLSTFVDKNNLGAVAIEKALVSLTRNDYEPDLCFFRREVADKITRDQMQLPAPDFIAEILSPSTERTDRHIKKRDYAAHGVTEYWIIDPEAQTVEQYALKGEDYHLLGTVSGDDFLTSMAMEGFRVPARAIFEREANLAALSRLTVA